MGLKIKKEVFRTMPRNSRKDLPGLFHHIMSQGINKEYIFNDERLKEKYKEILTEKMKENNVDIIAYCIMDNHVHLLIKVQNVQDMCRFMQQVNTTYAKFYNRLKHRVGFVFRNRYLSKAIQDENQLNKFFTAEKFLAKNDIEEFDDTKIIELNQEMGANAISLSEIEKEIRKNTGKNFTNLKDLLNQLDTYLGNSKKEKTHDKFDMER